VAGYFIPFVLSLRCTSMLSDKHRAKVRIYCTTHTYTLVFRFCTANKSHGRLQRMSIFLFRTYRCAHIGGVGRYKDSISRINPEQFIYLCIRLLVTSFFLCFLFRHLGFFSCFFHPRDNNKLYRYHNRHHIYILYCTLYCIMRPHVIPRYWK
jgi:hypothetical protein